MRIVITDTGYIWNHNNPFLEKYKDLILVVCLYGKKITDKYECFISPYKHVGMGIDRYGAEDQKLHALASVGQKLNDKLDCHEDIVFLADMDPYTLYPYNIIKDLNEWNRLHLIAMPPFDFFHKRQIKEHFHLLSDLSHLSSFFYYDINKKATEESGKSWPDFLSDTTNELGAILPDLLYGIDNMDEEPCFYDLNSMCYRTLDGEFNELMTLENGVKKQDTDVELKRGIVTMGLIVSPSYQEEVEYAKGEVEKPLPRIDGKVVCNILREQRVKLALANKISFISEECPIMGPCAGTCKKCDEEAAFLRNELIKIPKEKRHYPQFDPCEEMIK